MNITRKTVELVSFVTLLVILLIASTLLAAEQKTIKKYSIPDHGTLELNVPTSWKGEPHKPQQKMVPTIIFGPAKGNDFQVMISVLWGKAGDQDFNTKEKVRTFVEKDGQNLLPNAAEPNIVLQEIKGVNNTGYYFSLTEIKPPIRESTGI